MKRAILAAILVASTLAVFLSEPPPISEMGHFFIFEVPDELIYSATGEVTELFSAVDLGAALRARGIPADAFADVDAIVKEAAAEAKVGDVVLVMSNGAFGNIWEKLLDALGGAQS